MRIAIDARAAAEVPAGRGRYVRELLRGLARREEDHEYLLYARTPWLDGELDGRFRWVTPNAPGLSWPLAAGLAMSRRADVALACTSYAMTLPWRIPGAVIVWDFAPFDRALQPPRGSLLERLTLPVAIRRGSEFVAISNATGAELNARYPRSSSRTVIAQPAADASFRPGPVAGDDEVLRRLGVRGPYVLVTATLEPRKNLSRLIEAFAGLPADVRGDWTLLLAGARGWQTDPMLAEVARHADLVRALGYVSEHDLPALYRGAELFCYVSLYEGFGIPVLEAMQSGTAVLTSSVSSMPEVGGDAVRYANPLDIEDIRRGIAELLLDEQARARYAAAGPPRAALFDWDRTAATVLGVLERLPKGPRRRRRGWPVTPA
ncbi:MAG: glycosyltransferase family 4 protein [Solirubrobacterales bacterium]|nr:glycosyltransferase family 4 protein [Solirubrobacterales bacterium]